MAGCSFVSYRYDVFPSFSGVDVRKTFLSHLLKALDSKSINTFIDNRIERSTPIGPSLLTAIAEARISIVIFSKNYASSTWCLNELVEIHKCYKELGQIVIPVFYNVDPSEVRKQTGDFGKFFEETCEVSKDKQPEDQKQRWMEALKIIADIAGEDLLNGSSSEAAIIEKIADDVSNKLTSSSNCFDDFVGIEEQLEEMKPLLSLESKESRMIGIWGPSGIGKSTIGKALYSRLFSQFHFRAFIPHVYSIKSEWEDKFLSEILGKDIKIGGRLGVVEQMLNKKKVLAVLDDVDDPEFLKTLVGKSKWFGPGSRIIVISEDKRILDQAHDVDHLYEVKFPAQDIALKMLCQTAFGKNSPPNDFKELAVKVAKLAFNLPLGLSILGLSLRKKEKKDWVKIMPQLQNDLDENIEKQLRIRYDRLNQKDQELFLDVACFYNGYRVSYFEDFLQNSIEFKSLIDKSLVRITPEGYIEMHNFLEKLGMKIDRAETKGNPGKSRFLKNAEEILHVLTYKSGTKNVLGIFFKASETKKPFIPLDEDAFSGMYNLQFLKIHNYSLWSSTETCIVQLPKDFEFGSWPPKLRWLEWNSYPLKSLPYRFNTEYLVELRMEDSKLTRLWYETKPLGSLKTMDLSRSKYLKEIPNLSKAINLEELNLHGCISLVKLCSSIQVAIKLRKLNMRGCIKLKSFPTHLNFKSLHDLDLTFCHNLKNFPVIKMENSIFMPHEVEIRIDDCLWNRNLYETMWNSDLYGGLDYLGCLRTCLPCEFRPEYLVRLVVIGNKYIKKLWEGVQPLGSLTEIDLSECTELIEIPDLSKAINLWNLKLNNCESLVTLPSTIGSLQNLKRLEMRGCILLEVVPIDVTLLDLEILDLTGCKSLRNFPSDLMVYRKDL